MMHSDRERLTAGLTALGLSHDDEALEALESFLSEIALWNPRYKLIAAGEDFVARHVLDSLAGLTAIRRMAPRRLADVGSGAGFPGIPLAIYLPDTEISLIERSGRRAGFLRNVVANLGLENVRILEKPVEEAAADGPFDLVTFRAWSAVDEALLDGILPILSHSGSIVAYKGRVAVAQEELDRVSDRMESFELRPIEVPGLRDERCLLMMTPINPRP